ncbi:MAG TPA: methyltransferase domain-containing protein [Actinomycetota bacterium]|nr:methyltransferase domain-containing protein [Actinomycetota bacterium]
MGEHSGARQIRRFLAEVERRGADAIADFFAPDVVWHVAAGNPEPGTFTGCEKLAAYYRRHRLGQSQPVKVDRLTVLAGDSYGAAFLDVSVPLQGDELQITLPQLFRTGPEGLWDEYWILQPPERTPPLPRSVDELKDSGFLRRGWYYSIELAPGVFTPGRGLVNLGLTRTLLNGCDVEGRRCLDIGTMEGAVPVLLSRRGASKVVGVDILAHDPEVELVRRFTGARFDYHSGLTHQQTVPFVSREHGAFDLVVFSGVMYHTFSPLHALATARSLVRTGGLLLVETNSAVDEESAMFFNTEGRFSEDGSTYFLTSVRLLEYLLRYFKLQPLDCVAGPHTPDGGKKAARVAVICRAMGEMPADADPWMRSAAEQVDYKSLIAWHVTEGAGRDAVSYGPPVSPFVDPKTGSCDVVRTVNEAPPMDLPPAVATIRLGDRF